MASGKIPEPVHSTESGYGSTVDLTSYNSTSNRYTCPKHGYLYVRCTSAATGFLAIYGSSGTGYMRAGGAAGNYFNYIRKGMRVYVSGNVDAAYFVPLI